MTGFLLRKQDNHFVESTVNNIGIGVKLDRLRDICENLKYQIKKPEILLITYR